uniref:Uncharacterized protein n=1 Tax=Anguilla anguilla TaxID=7936 RepID=A0A0E9V1T1_ANGAN
MKMPQLGGNPPNMVTLLYRHVAT